MRVRMLMAVVLVVAVGFGLVGRVELVGSGQAAGSLVGVLDGQPPPSPPPQRPPQGRVPTAPTTGGPQRPARDPRLMQQPTTGTGVVSGRVVDAATGQPLQRVRVRFMGREGRSTLTDSQGAFTFTKLPRGGVMMMAEKASYLIAQFPERRQTMRNATMMLADGQKIENVTIPMTRSSAIVGRLVDHFGDPVEGVNIQALAVDSNRRSPMRMFGPMGRMGMQSNDIGEFRIARLEPGTYYLLASPQRRQDEEGSAIGKTFYPGVPSIEQAQMITVEKGQTVTGVEFPMLETTLVKVMGSVVSASGEQVTGGNVAARSPAPPGMPMGMAMGMFDGGTGIRNDGTFELRLQPGDYTLEAMPMTATAPGQMQPTRERGQVKLSVGTEPLQNVVITAGSGATASGKIVFNGRKAPPTDLRGAQVVFQNATPDSSDCRANGGMASPQRPTVNPDGTFVAENLWGSCLARASGVQGWQLESVMHRGTDVTTRAIQFEPGRHVTDLQLVFTDRVGDLTLDVQDERGLPISEYVAIVFPIEKEKWSDQRFLRTHIASASMDQAMAQAGMAGRQMMTMSGITMSGSPSSVSATLQPGQTPGAAGPTRPPIVKGLIAGEYYAVVVDDIGWEDLRDPEMLAQLANVATRVTIAEGDAPPLQLRRVPVPDSR